MPLGPDAVSTLILDGYRLTYTSAGAPGAPPLIMIHGFVSHRGVWRQTIHALQQHYRCIAVDLLGFGDSDKPHDGDYTLEAQGQRILALADALECETFTLLGHSMGGQIALYLTAALAPARVVRWISVAGVVTGRLTPIVEQVAYPQIGMGASAPWLYSVWRTMSHYPWYAYAFFRPWFHRMDALPFQQWARDRHMALQPGIPIPAYRAAQAIKTSDLTAHLANIQVPTLVIFGQQDATVPVTDGALVKQQVANSQLVLIDQCGHFPMYEQPQQYLQALRQFLLHEPQGEP